MQLSGPQSVGSIHSPSKQTSLPLHATHASPSAPHALTSVPDLHVAPSRQPSQTMVTLFVALFVDVLFVDVLLVLFGVVLLVVALFPGNPF